MKKYLLSVPLELLAWIKYQATIKGLTINQFIISLISDKKEAGNESDKNS